MSQGEHRRPLLSMLETGLPLMTDLKGTDPTKPELAILKLLGARRK